MSGLDAEFRPCWRSECRLACYYPNACDRAPAARVQAPEPQGGGLTETIEAHLWSDNLGSCACAWTPTYPESYAEGEEDYELHQWAEHLADSLAARAVPAETLADRVRALADEWRATFDAGRAERDKYGTTDGVTRIITLDKAADRLLGLLDPAEQPATREDDA